MSQLIVPDLREHVLRFLRQIPPGKVSSYGQIAAALGDLRASQWVGWLLKHDPDREDWPWYRVVRAGGFLSDSSPQDAVEQQLRLSMEGVLLEHQRVTEADFWSGPFTGPAPLKELRQQQEQLKTALQNEGMPSQPRTVAGLDVAYPQPDRGQGAYVEWDLDTQKVTYQKTVTVPISFPYLPGFLSYRELPVHQAMVAAVVAERPLADLFLVDGTGRLHPRQLGIACHLGFLCEPPTIGISKKLLYGQIAPHEPEDYIVPIYEKSASRGAGQQLGWAMKNLPRHQPVYVSPGNRCTVEQARDLVSRCWGKHRLPEPVFLADRLSKVKPA